MDIPPASAYKSPWARCLSEGLMKKIFLVCTLLLSMTAAFRAFAQEGPPEGYGPNGPNGPNQPYPPNFELEKHDENGWFLGSDLGVLFFVGNGEHFIGPQFYSSFFGGYNIRGIVQPILRLGQAVGSTNGFFHDTTFFFMMDAGLRFTPLRTKFRPFFLGTVGFYSLSFNDFGFPVFADTNLTFTGGGGLEYKFGPNRINVASEYRGFINNGIDLRGVEVTLGYSFQF